MRKVIVACSALALGSAVMIHAQERSVLLNGNPVVVTAGPAGRGVILKLPLEARVVKGLPYSAEIVTESIQTLADGNRIVQRTTGRVYRDNEGRVRREEDRPSGGPTISISDPVAGTTFTLDPANRTARETPTRISYVTQALEALSALRVRVDAVKQAAGGTGPAAGERSAAPPPATVEGRGGRGGRGGPGGPGADALTEEKLPDRVIEGVLATGVRRTTTITKGAIGNEQPIRIVSEEWTSPELQVLVLTDHNDPRTGRSTYRLLRISRTDLDPALFQVPADYTFQRVLLGLPGGRGGRGQ